MAMLRCHICDDPFGQVDPYRKHVIDCQEQENLKLKAQLAIAREGLVKCQFYFKSEYPGQENDADKTLSQIDLTPVAVQEVMCNKFKRIHGNYEWDTILPMINGSHPGILVVLPGEQGPGIGDKWDPFATSEYPPPKGEK